MSECGVKEFKLRELLKIYNGTKYDHLNKGDIPLYGSGGLMSHVNEALYSGEAILLPRKGTLSNIMYVNESFWTVDTMYYAVVNDKLADAFYLYSYLSQLDLSNLDSGSTLPSMTKSAYESIVVKLPDLKIQKAVATVLFNIRKKLEINNQINQELEAMAKTLYDYWFVQFDFPDENGKPYKSSGGKMVYNDQLKREIPEGWGVKKVSEIAKTGSGGTPKSTTAEYYSNGTIPWINSGELNKSIIISTTNYITEFGFEESSAKLFPADSILIAMYGATAGKVSFLAFESSTNQAICAVTLDDNRLKYYFKFFIEDLYLHLVTLSSGSARDNLSQELIRNLLMTIPDERVVENFFNLVDSYFLQITNNLKQNQELTQLRDWLLPMLMNGQVKV